LTYRRIFLSFFLLITTLRITAQSEITTFDFIENKGQWDSRVKFRGPLSAGSFYLHNNGFKVVLHNEEDLRQVMDRHNVATATSRGTEKPWEPDSNLTKFPQPGSNTSKSVRSHAYTVQFVGANENPLILPDKILPTYNNYFIGSDTSKWQSHVRIFQAVVYKNVYPNIDIRYYSENSQLKYDFIIHPGGSVNDIVMKFEGVDKLSIRNRELIVKTSVGEVKELSPYSYQFDNVKGRQPVECNYELTGSTVRFRVKNHDTKSTLIIDPTLIFSSFSGSRADEYGFTATPGPDGSLYAGGRVTGTGYPVTNGAYQVNFGGGTGNNGVDIGITKFSATGTQRLYSTYLGGTGNEYPHSLISDPAGNLVVMGRSYSGDTYPKTVPKAGSGGGSDIVVSKFSSNGATLIGSMIIGGAEDDGVNINDVGNGAAVGQSSLLRFYGDDSRSEVVMDPQGNIYVAAQSKSLKFPVTPGVFQGTLGGAQDGVVIKLNPNCNAITWASYIGGTANDGAFVLEIRPNTNEIYVAGATASPNFPGNKAGSLTGTFQGGDCDGFVSVIANDGSSITKTTYLGTNTPDVVYGIKFDKLGFPYVMGITGGAWPVINAGAFAPNSSQFVSKLQPDLSGYIYSTVFGTGNRKPNMSPVAFLVDRCENIYISGWGGWIQTGNDPYLTAGVAGMPITPDAIKSVTDNRDFYFIVLKKNATQVLYGSFFGQDGAEGEHVDGGTSRYDQQGVIYQAICANCFQNGPGQITKPYPITPGVIGPVNGAGRNGCNLGALKISFNFSGVAAGPKAFVGNDPDSTGCVPFAVTLRDTIRNAKQYIWTFGDGSPDLTTDSFEVNHVFGSVGNFLVRLIAIDSTSCNIRDTAYTTIRVRTDRANIAMNILKLPPCQDLNYRFENLSAAPAGKPFGPNSFIWDFGDGSPRLRAGAGPVDHRYPAAGTYYARLILVDTNYCNAPDSLIDTLRVSPLVKAQFTVPSPACAPFNAVFVNNSLAGETFFWDFGDGTTSTATNPVHLYPNVGNYTVKLVARDPNTCNILDSIQHTISVSIKPTADFNYAPSPPEINKAVVFTNLSTGGVRYKYLFGDGDSAIVTTLSTTSHQYNATGTFTACLITYNQYGCPDTICKPVQAQVVPLLDVPNAFTPGRFGKNSIVRAEGFGINRMMFRIYNRWGQKVFESNDQRLGWDGNFNGKPQPMEVYAYVLDVEFSDGSKTRKTGDITLIR
jgi:gliding motility-associated-like protein